MKKLFSSALLILVVICGTSCKKPKGETDKTYYHITFKANGVEEEYKEYGWINIIQNGSGHILAGIMRKGTNLHPYVQFELISDAAFKVSYNYTNANLDDTQSFKLIYRGITGPEYFSAPSQQANILKDCIFKITEKTPQYAKGVFSGTFYSKTTPVTNIKITDGQFYLKLQQ